MEHEIQFQSDFDAQMRRKAHEMNIAKFCNGMVNILYRSTPFTSSMEYVFPRDFDHDLRRLHNEDYETYKREAYARRAAEIAPTIPYREKFLVDLQGIIKAVKVEDTTAAYGCHCWVSQRLFYGKQGKEHELYLDPALFGQGAIVSLEYLEDVLKRFQSAKFKGETVKRNGKHEKVIQARIIPIAPVREYYSALELRFAGVTVQLYSPIQIED